MSCIDANVLIEWTHGQLPGDEAAGVVRHLSRCAACRRLVGLVDSERTPGASALDGMPPVDTVLEPGTMVDHFRVIVLRASGAMGDVYLARDTQLGRKVALKIIRAARSDSPDLIDRFLLEAQVTASLSHPNIVTIYAAGRFGDLPYLALGYLRGETLQERLSRRRPGLEEAVRIGHAVAGALREAHSLRVLHRDLTPANVFLPLDGRPRVLDFGLALVLPGRRTLAGSAEAEEPLAGGEPDGRHVGSWFHSHGGGLRGTPEVMAPEQWARRPATEATDIWAFGVVLHLMAAGQHPYHGLLLSDLRAEVMSSREAPRSPDLSSVPERLGELIDRCLAKPPGRRPSAEEAEEALGGLLTRRRQPSSPEQSPFPGLQSFSEQQAGQFHGREQEIAATVERLRKVALLTVVGPSGVGKSSMVHAGVVRRLREQGPWIVIKLRPGRRPFEALARRLAVAASNGQRHLPEVPDTEEAAPGDEGVARHEGAQAEALLDTLQRTPWMLSLNLRQIAEERGARVLLVVDQLEELFTQAKDTHQGRGFLQSLSACADDPEDPVRVLLVVRDDFLHRLAESEVGATTREVLLVRRPGRRALKEILTRPVEELGYQYDDPGLVEGMVDRVEDQEAGLPMLQFVCAELWARRDRSGRLLRRADYEEVGGVEGALARHADGVLEGLPARQREAARRLLLSLVTADGTRRVLSRADALGMLEGGDVDVLDRLVGSRLIVSRKGDQVEDELELAHESLIQTWRRLARWIEQGRSEKVLLDDLLQAAELWKRRGHQDDELWSGHGLAEARQVLVRHPAAVPGIVRRFVAAGEQRQRRISRRRKMGVTAMALLALLATLAAVAFALQRQTARREAAEASQARRRAEGQRAEAQREGAWSALTRGDPLQARAKLRMSLQTRDSPLARALWWRLLREPRRWCKKMFAPVIDVALSPDGRTVAVVDQTSSLSLLDSRTRAARQLRGPVRELISAAFSPNGRMIAAAGWSGEVVVWRLPSGRRAALPGHQGNVPRLAFSPDSTLLATAGHDGTVRLWDPQSGTQRRVIRGHRGKVYDVAFHPDGRSLASAGGDGTVRIWAAGSGAQRRTLAGHEGRVNGVVFNTDGTLIASVGHDRTVRLWRTSTGEAVRVMVGHAAPVLDVSFSAGGRRLASGGLDRTIRLWDPATGRQLAVLRGQGAEVLSLAHSARGELLASGGRDKRVCLWSPIGVKPPLPSWGDTGFVYGIAFSPGGDLLATGGRDGGVRLWDLPSGRQRAAFTSDDGTIRELAFTPDGARLIAANQNGTIRIRETATGRSRGVLLGHRAMVTGVAVGSRGRTLVSSSMDSTVRIWDLPSGRTIHVLSHPAGVEGLALGPGAKKIAAADRKGDVHLWDIPGARRLRVLRGHRGPVYGVGFSPDGTRLAVGDYAGTVRLWDLQSGTSRVLDRGPGSVRFLSFSPDGKHVGVPRADGVVKVLDLGGHVRGVLSGHGSEANYVRFHANGRWIATSSDDGTARLWDARSGRPLWHAAAMLRSTRELYAGGRWVSLGSGPAGKGGKNTRWRQTLERRARWAEEAPGGRLLCVHTFGDRLELWDQQRDRLLSRHPVDGLGRVVAVAGGCLTLARGVATLWRPGSAARRLAAGATAVGQVRGEILVASGATVKIFNAAGIPRRSVQVLPGATALTRAGQWLVLGYDTGRITRWPLHGTGHVPRLSFTEPPPSAAVLLHPGPQDTVVAGHASGDLGLWSLERGTWLLRAKLHGAARHLLVHGRRMHVSSELGHHLSLDLAPFHAEYCRLMEEVWRAVPVVWASTSGAPIRRQAPRTHPCRRRAGRPTGHP